MTHHTTTIQRYPKHFDHDSSGAVPLLHRVRTAPPVAVVDLRSCGLDRLERLLAAGAVVKVAAHSMAEVLAVLKAGGFILQNQYETVRHSHLDPTVFRAVASVTAADAETSATKTTPTRPHIDMYQVDPEYAGTIVGGVSNMPQREVLEYGTLFEPRVLGFFDMFEACRTFLDEQGLEVLLDLTRPVFEIDPKYTELDHRLQSPGKFPFIYLDGGDWRLHVGGGMRSQDPDAAFALLVFMAHLNRTVLLDTIESDTIYISNSTRVAHAGYRYREVRGETVLTRRLLRRQPARCASDTLSTVHGVFHVEATTLGRNAAAMVDSLISGVAPMRLLKFDFLERPHFHVYDISGRGRAYPLPQVGFAEAISAVAEQLPALLATAGHESLSERFLVDGVVDGLLGNIRGVSA